MGENSFLSPLSLQGGTQAGALLTQVDIPSATHPHQIPLSQVQVSVTAGGLQVDPKSLGAGFNPFLVSPQPLLLQPWKPRAPQQPCLEQGEHPEHPLCNHMRSWVCCPKWMWHFAMPGKLLFYICPTIWNAAHSEMFVSHMLALEAVTSSLPAEQCTTACSK